MSLLQLQNRGLHLSGRHARRLSVRARVRLPAGLQVQRLRLLQPKQVTDIPLRVHEEGLLFTTKARRSA
jgi:hypothetical protein